MNLGMIVEKWDGLLYSCYNFLARGRYICQYPFLYEFLKKNKELKNKHSGERCFVVLNGPSINQYDLSALSKEQVFCTNYFFRSTLTSIVKPNYYCWLDFHSGNINEVTEYVHDIREKCPGVKMIFNSKVRKLIGKQDDVYYTYNKHLPSIFGISKNMSGFFSGFMNVCLYAVVAAIYMGFKKIYIMGFDFEPGAFKHFQHINEDTDPKTETDKLHVAGSYWSYTKVHFESYALEKYARKCGVEIINLNKESHIRAFEFGDFNKVITP